MSWFALILARNWKKKNSSDVATGGWTDSCVGETICLHHRVALVTATLQTQGGNGHERKAANASSSQYVTDVLNISFHRSAGVRQRLRVWFSAPAVTVKFEREKQPVSFWSKILYVALPQGEKLMTRQSGVANSTQCVINKLADTTEYQLPFKLRGAGVFISNKMGRFFLDAHWNASRRVCVILLLFIL